MDNGLSRHVENTAAAALGLEETFQQKPSLYRTSMFRANQQNIDWRPSRPNTHSIAATRLLPRAEAETEASHARVD